MPLLAFQAVSSNSTDSPEEEEWGEDECRGGCAFPGSESNIWLGGGVDYKGFGVVRQQALQFHGGERVCARVCFWTEKGSSMSLSEAVADGLQVRGVLTVAQDRKDSWQSLRHSCLWRRNQHSN